MLKAPPMFDFGPTEATSPMVKNAESALVLCAAQQTDTTTDWWAVANDIANAINDANTLAEVERVKAENLANLRALTTNRRDLAELLSVAFADRRRQLGRG